MKKLQLSQCTKSLFRFTNVLPKHIHQPLLLSYSLLWQIRVGRTGRGKIGTKLSWRSYQRLATRRFDARRMSAIDQMSSSTNEHSNLFISPPPHLPKPTSYSISLNGVISLKPCHIFCCRYGDWQAGNRFAQAVDRVNDDKRILWTQI